MRVKTKKLASIVIASILAFSATTGGVGLTASAADNCITLFSTEGISNSAVYSSGAYLYSTWQAESSVIGATTEMNFNSTTSKIKLTTMSLAKTAYLNNLTTDDMAVTGIGADRYLIMPLLESGKTNPKSNNKLFKNIVGGFENSSIQFDILKGATELITSSKFTKIQMGLAYIDYSSKHSYTRHYTDNGVEKTSSQECYPAGISWIDITNKFPDYNTTRYTNASGKTFDTLKTTMSIPVCDIINGGETKYINGANAETHKLTANNANAVVFNIVVNDSTYFVGGNSMLINNIILSTPADVSAKAVTEKNSDDTYKARIVFDEINPSDYANVVFKVGEDYYGNTVENAFGAVINGTANIGIILSDATSSDVSVWFTNKDLTYAAATVE